MVRLEKLRKIKGINELGKYGLPYPETIFIFDFDKQEKEIDEFIKNKKFVTIRSDKENNLDFCPCDLMCKKDRAKKSIRKILSKGYVVILQKHIPIKRDRVSGNILILKNYLITELMGLGALTQLNREGRVEEQIKFRKKDLKETGHFGKRLISAKEIKNIMKMVKNLPIYKVVEFTLRPEGIYFWQIRDDKTAKKLEG